MLVVVVLMMLVLVLVLLRVLVLVVLTLTSMSMLLMMYVPRVHVVCTPVCACMHAQQKSASAAAQRSCRVLLLSAIALKTVRFRLETVL